MKKLQFLALSMLLSTSAVIMQAKQVKLYEVQDEYDAEHNLNKQRDSYIYDGSHDACDGEFETDDTYDQEHHLNKKRNSETHCLCEHTGKRIACPRKLHEKQAGEKSKKSMDTKRSDRSMESLIEKMDNASPEMLEKVASKLLIVTEMRQVEMEAQAPMMEV